MADILPRIDIHAGHAEVMTSWFNTAAARLDFDVYQRESRSVLWFGNFMAKEDCYAAGANGAPEAVILGRGNILGMFLVDSGVSAKRLPLVALSASYWCLLGVQEQGFDELHWEQPAANTFLDWHNKLLPPQKKEVHGRDPISQEAHSFWITLNIKDSLEFCENAIRDLQ